MARIHVLRPFVYSCKPAPDHRMPTERHFRPGHHEIANDDPMFSDPWITKYFADGAIETPEAAQARAKQKAAEAAAAAEEGARATASAEAAFARSGSPSSVSTSNYEAHQKALNTPVNELKGASGTSIDEVSPEQARVAAEATPDRSEKTDEESEEVSPEDARPQAGPPWASGRPRGKGGRSR